MGLLGAHVSIAGGIENAIERGEELGCEAVQIFSKNQRQWRVDALTQKSVNAFRNARQDSQIQQVVIHDSYLINLASPDTETLKKSREAFLDEMMRADKLGVEYLVFHPGSHMKTSDDAGLQRIAESLNIVLEKQPDGQVELLLETTAGQGDHLGYCFEQLAEIISFVVKKEKIGICYDTAHAFAAGYDIRTETTYEKTFSEFHGILGLDRLCVFHLNDSKSGLGSRTDRHEHIGQGQMGLEPFRFLVNDSRFQRMPMILETPGPEVCFQKNLELLRSLIHSGEKR